MSTFAVMEAPTGRSAEPRAEHNIPGLQRYARLAIVLAVAPFAFTALARAYLLWADDWRRAFAMRLNSWTFGDTPYFLLTTFMIAWAVFFKAWAQLTPDIFRNLGRIEDFDQRWAGTRASLVATSALAGCALLAFIPVASLHRDIWTDPSILTKWVLSPAVWGFMAALQASIFMRTTAVLVSYLREDPQPLLESSTYMRVLTNYWLLMAIPLTLGVLLLLLMGFYPVHGGVGHEVRVAANFACLFGALPIAARILTPLLVEVNRSIRRTTLKLSDERADRKAKAVRELLDALDANRPVAPHRERYEALQLLDPAPEAATWWPVERRVVVQLLVPWVLAAATVAARLLLDGPGE